ncbi:REP-associated tyrosine transposase [Pseudomonas lurida]|jgi:REP element-mobilizing transposase RayT|uniref:REP-associated tyrosine transposase n=1 Tax=Pseudomonas lurida TaxID=244566 RepID=UPI0009B8F079|nr:transposase [Pseudomonas lurida]MBC3924407.1 transposase [Pseudomonas lurida]
MPDQPASNRLRIGRYDEPNRIYLLTSNTLDRIPVFSDFKLGRLVVQQFQIAQHQGLVTSLAWVVMPDHFHWLISLEKGSLADLMRQVKSKSTRIVNAVSGRQGRLWQPGFHDHAVRRDESLEGIARYIVANPVRAGLVKKCGDYSLWDAIWL